MGNLRPCGVSWALISRPRGTLRGEWQSGDSGALGAPCPCLLLCRGLPAGDRGQSQAGSNCPSPGRGRTLRSRRSLAGVCCVPGSQRRREGLHCDPDLCVLTSHSLFLDGILGRSGPFGHLVRARGLKPEASGDRTLVTRSHYPSTPRWRLRR